VPTGAEDIGTWLDILQITSVVSVITNAALVCYTMQLTSDYSDVGQLWIFIGFQYTIFVIMAIFAYVVDDCPEEVCATAGCLLCIVQLILYCVGGGTLAAPTHCRLCGVWAMCVLVSCLARSLVCTKLRIANGLWVRCFLYCYLCS
jgi:hypothetical protein